MASAFLPDVHLMYICVPASCLFSGSHRSFLSRTAFSSFLASFLILRAAASRPATCGDASVKHWIKIIAIQSVVVLIILLLLYGVWGRYIDYFRQLGVTSRSSILYSSLQDQMFICGGSVMTSTIPADLLELKACFEIWRTN